MSEEYMTYRDKIYIILIVILLTILNILNYGATKANERAIEKLQKEIVELKGAE